MQIISKCDMHVETALEQVYGWVAVRNACRDIGLATYHAGAVLDTRKGYARRGHAVPGACVRASAYPKFIWTSRCRTTSLPQAELRVVCLARSLCKRAVV